MAFVSASIEKRSFMFGTREEGRPAGDRSSASLQMVRFALQPVLQTFASYTLSLLLSFQQTTSMAPTVYPGWLLFGDSITQQSFSAGGYGQWMSDNYQRRADIINRGYGGYNTEWALRIMPYVGSN